MLQASRCIENKSQTFPRVYQALRGLAPACPLGLISSTLSLAGTLLSALRTSSFFLLVAPTPALSQPGLLISGVAFPHKHKYLSARLGYFSEVFPNYSFKSNIPTLFLHQLFLPEIIAVLRSICHMLLYLL